jgi:inosine/xanthosine triphosphatase
MSYNKPMKHVIVASENPVKINVAKRSFAAVFPDKEFMFTGVKSESGVPEQPMDDETRKGAENRLRFIMDHHPYADFWISQEGGLCTEDDRFFERAWILVTDRTGFIGESTTGQFYLPKKIAEYVREGMELGTAGDRLFGGTNLKQGIGVIGHLTDGLIDRTEYYLPAAIIALSALKHKEWY